MTHHCDMALFRQEVYFKRGGPVRDILLVYKMKLDEELQMNNIPQT